MILSRYTINNINSETVQVPDSALFHLPEKVLQFGTGALLRSLPDRLIDEANRQGFFNGRIVAVTPSQAEATLFEKQDCVYTVCFRVNHGGQVAEEARINTAISRVLHDKTEWQQVLDCAHNPELKLILSDTTEENLQLANDDVRLHPPKTFPGKLLAFLQERYTAFGGSPQSGMVVIPTSNEADTGRKLEAVVFELAHLNGLDDAFIEWLERSNQFCHAVAGKAGTEAAPVLSGLLPEGLAYTDSLLIVADASQSWTIETDEDPGEVLPFAKAVDGVVIRNFREPQTEGIAG